MALTNYANLLTSAADWTHRTDLAAIIPDWVTLCETTINMGDGDTIEGLRTSAQETTATLICIPGTQTVNLPADFLEIRKIYINFSGIRRELIGRPITPISNMEASNVRSIPEGFYITGNTLYLIPIPYQAFTITLLYYAKIGPLATSLTNWLMTAAPGVYLFGTILHGAPWLGPTFNAEPWARGFALGMKQVAGSDTSRWTNIQMRSEAAGMLSGGYGYASFLSGQ